MNYKLTNLFYHNTPIILTKTNDKTSRRKVANEKKKRKNMIKNASFNDRKQRNRENKNQQQRRNIKNKLHLVIIKTQRYFKYLIDGT